MTSTTTRRAAVAATLAAAAAATLVGTAAADPSDRGRGDGDLAAVRRATAAFHDVRAAEAAGYVRVSPCEQSPAGAMGFHYLNPALAQDAVLDPERPELLLYVPQGDRLQLAAVEWFVAEAATGGQRPSVLGRPLDGPMPGHTPQMPRHYDLHVWVWKHNPSGVAAPWNPALSC
jgi:hypothetical protein